MVCSVCPTPVTGAIPGSTELLPSFGTELRTLVKWLRKPEVHPARGAIAQLGERVVRNDEAVGSIPTSSTNFFKHSA